MITNNINSYEEKDIGKSIISITSSHHTSLAYLWTVMVLFPRTRT